MNVFDGRCSSIFFMLSRTMTGLGRSSQEMRRYIFGEWLFEADEYDLVDEYNIERYGVPNDTGDGLHNEIWLPVRRKRIN